MKKQDVPEWLNEITQIVATMLPPNTNFVLFTQQIDESKKEEATKVSVQMNCCPCEVIRDIETLTKIWADYINHTHNDEPTKDFHRLN